MYYQRIANVKISNQTILVNLNIKFWMELETTLGLVQQHLQEIGGSPKGRE